MKKIAILTVLLTLIGCGNGFAQTIVPDTLLFVFKLHGQTRRYQMSFHEQGDTLCIDWRILRNLHWQTGTYQMTPESVGEADRLCFLQPVDKETRLLAPDETAYILSRRAYKQLKATGTFDYNRTTYKQGDGGGEALGVPLLRCIDQTEGAEVWILDHPSLPIVWKMQNNPLNINWQVEHPTVRYKEQ